jgi:hypothetical protein
VRRKLCLIVFVNGCPCGPVVLIQWRSPSPLTPIQIPFPPPPPHTANASSAPGTPGTRPTYVTGFELRRACGDASASSSTRLRLHNLTTPVTIRLPRPSASWGNSSSSATSRSQGPSIQCKRGIQATYDVTCGRGSDAVVTQVRTCASACVLIGAGEHRLMLGSLAIRLRTGCAPWPAQQCCTVAMLPALV